MKRILPTVIFILAAVMLLSACASADQPSAAPAAGSEAAAPAASGPAAESPAESAPVDPLVGTWRFPPSPFGDDFTCYVVLNADGSFMNVTNLYESGKNSGPYTQKVDTNETFTWVRTGATTLELHYSYLDDNGEFETPLTYDPKTDTLYLWGQIYAERAEPIEILG